MNFKSEILHPDESGFRMTTMLSVILSAAKNLVVKRLFCE